MPFPRAAGRVTVGLVLFATFLTGVIVTTRSPRVPVATEFVFVGEAVPAGNLVFITPDSLLCPAVNDLYHVRLGAEGGSRKVYSHPQWVERVAASGDGKRVIVASNSGLTELTWVDGLLTKSAELVLNREANASAPESPFGDLLVWDDGSLAFTTREGGATVYRRVGADGPVETVYTLADDPALTRNPRAAFLHVYGTFMDLKRRHVHLAYSGGIATAPLDPTGRPSNIPLPGRDAFTVLPGTQSGGLYIGSHTQLLCLDASGRVLVTIKLPGAVSATAAVPGRGLVAVLQSRATLGASDCQLLRADSLDKVVSLPLAPKAGGQSLAVSPDGSRLAAVTGYGDRTLLKVWKLADVLP